MLEQSWKKVYSRTTTKSIPLVQPNHEFCQQNGPELGQLRDWYPDEKWSWSLFLWMVDIVPQGAWVLYRITKDEGYKSLPFLVFQRHIVNAIFLKYLKEGRWSSSHVGIRNILCYVDGKYYQVQSEHKRTQRTLQASKMECFCVNS